jgi:hypothetical protein
MTDPSALAVESRVNLRALNTFGLPAVAGHLVRVRSADLGEQPLTVYLSLNFLAEHRLEVGGRLPLRLLPERMRIFD